jgi:uncharacterized protein (TIGR03437 family)
LLAQDSGKPPSYYDYCSNSVPWNPPSVGAISWWGLRPFLQKIAANGQQVDVVAYGAAGLFVRNCIAGLDGVPPIRKLVLVGSPNFGIATQLASGINGGIVNGVTPVQRLLNLATDDILPWSNALWSLNNWNQRGDDLRGVDAVAIAGNGGNTTRASDGLVSVNSASLSFAFPDGDQRTRVLNTYCHGSILLDAENCAGGLIANVTGTTHPTYQIIRSFLDGTDTWKTIGLPASQASKTGGIVWGSYDGVNDNTTPTLTSSTASTPLLTAPILGYRGYLDFFPSSPATIEFLTTVWSGAANGWVAQKETQNVTISPGTYQAVYQKSVTRIDSFGVRPSAPLPPGARSVAADSLISIYGQNLAASTASASYPWPIQLAGTSVAIDGTPCPVIYVSPGQVNAKLPANITPGMHGLSISIPLQDPYSGATQRAQDSFAVMIEPAVPAMFALAGNTAAALHGNYQTVSASYPAAAGETIALYATGLGAVTSRSGLQVANATPQVWIDGIQATVAFAGRAPGYQGLDQINVQIPTGVHHGTSVPVVVVSPSGLMNPTNRSSNTVLLAIN